MLDYFSFERDLLIKARLEALEPEKLEEIAEQTTLFVIDMHRFNAKKEAEEHDAEELLKYDRWIMGILGDEIERIGEK